MAHRSSDEAIPGGEMPRLGLDVIVTDGSLALAQAGETANSYFLKAIGTIDLLMASGDIVYQATK